MEEEEEFLLIATGYFFLKKRQAIVNGITEIQISIKLTLL